MLVDELAFHLSSIVILTETQRLCGVRGVRSNPGGSLERPGTDIQASTLAIVQESSISCLMSGCGHDGGSRLRGESLDVADW